MGQGVTRSSTSFAGSHLYPGNEAFAHSTGHWPSSAVGTSDSHSVSQAATCTGGTGRHAKLSPSLPSLEHNHTPRRHGRQGSIPPVSSDWTSSAPTNPVLANSPHSVGNAGDDTRLRRDAEFREHVLATALNEVTAMPAGELECMASGFLSVLDYMYVAETVKTLTNSLLRQNPKLSNPLTGTAERGTTAVPREENAVYLGGSPIAQSFGVPVDEVAMLPWMMVRDALLSQIAQLSSCSSQSAPAPTMALTVTATTMSPTPSEITPSNRSSTVETLTNTFGDSQHTATSAGADDRAQAFTPSDLKPASLSLGRNAAITNPGRSRRADPSQSSPTVHVVDEDSNAMVVQPDVDAPPALQAAAAAAAAAEREAAGALDPRLSEVPPPLHGSSSSAAPRPSTVATSATALAGVPSSQPLPSRTLTGPRPLSIEDLAFVTSKDEVLEFYLQSVSRRHLVRGLAHRLTVMTPHAAFRFCVATSIFTANRKLSTSVTTAANASSTTPSMKKDATAPRRNRAHVTVNATADGEDGYVAREAVKGAEWVFAESVVERPPDAEELRTLALRQEAFDTMGEDTLRLLRETQELLQKSLVEFASTVPLSITSRLSGDYMMPTVPIIADFVGCGVHTRRAKEFFVPMAERVTMLEGRLGFKSGESILLSIGQLSNHASQMLSGFAIGAITTCTLHWRELMKDGQTPWERLGDAVERCATNYCTGFDIFCNEAFPVLRKSYPNLFVSSSFSIPAEEGGRPPMLTVAVSALLKLVFLFAGGMESIRADDRRWMNDSTGDEWGGVGHGDKGVHTHTDTRKSAMMLSIPSSSSHGTTITSGTAITPVMAFLPTGDVGSRQQTLKTLGTLHGSSTTEERGLSLSPVIADRVDRRRGGSCPPTACGESGRASLSVSASAPRGSVATVDQNDGLPKMTDDVALSAALQVPSASALVLMGAALLKCPRPDNATSTTQASYMSIAVSRVWRVVFQVAGLLPHGTACPKEMPRWLPLFPMYAVSTEAKRLLLQVHAQSVPYTPICVGPIQRGDVLKSTCELIRDVLCAEAEARYLRSIEDSRQRGEGGCGSGGVGMCAGEHMDRCTSASMSPSATNTIIGTDKTLSPPSMLPTAAPSHRGSPSVEPTTTTAGSAVTSAGQRSAASTATPTKSATRSSEVPYRNLSNRFDPAAAAPPATLVRSRRIMPVFVPPSKKALSDPGVACGLLAVEERHIDTNVAATMRQDLFELTVEQATAPFLPAVSLTKDAQVVPLAGGIGDVRPVVLAEVAAAGVKRYENKIVLLVSWRRSAVGGVQNNLRGVASTVAAAVAAAPRRPQGSLASDKKPGEQEQQEEEGKNEEARNTATVNAHGNFVFPVQVGDELTIRWGEPLKTMPASQLPDSDAATAGKKPIEPAVIVVNTDRSAAEKEEQKQETEKAITCTPLPHPPVTRRDGEQSSPYSSRESSVNSDAVGSRSKSSGRLAWLKRLHPLKKEERYKNKSEEASVTTSTKSTLAASARSSSQQKQRRQQQHPKSPTVASNEPVPFLTAVCPPPSMPPPQQRHTVIAVLSTNSPFRRALVLDAPNYLAWYQVQGSCAPAHHSTGLDEAHATTTSSTAPQDRCVVSPHSIRGRRQSMHSLLSLSMATLTAAASYVPVVVDLLWYHRIVPPLRRSVSEPWAWTNPLNCASTLAAMKARVTPPGLSIPLAPPELWRPMLFGWLLGQSSGNEHIFALPLPPLAFRILARAVHLEEPIESVRLNAADVSLLYPEHSRSALTTRLLEEVQGQMMLASGTGSATAPPDDMHISGSFAVVRRHHQRLQKQLSHMLHSWIWNIESSVSASRRFWGAMVEGLRLSPIAEAPVFAQCCARTAREVLCGAYDHPDRDFTFKSTFLIIANLNAPLNAYRNFARKTVIRVIEEELSTAEKRLLLRLWTGHSLLTQSPMTEVLIIEFDRAFMSVDEAKNVGAAGGAGQQASRVRRQTTLNAEASGAPVRNQRADIDSTLQLLPITKSVANTLYIPNYFEALLMGSYRKNILGVEPPSLDDAEEPQDEEKELDLAAWEEVLHKAWSELSAQQQEMLRRQFRALLLHRLRAALYAFLVSRGEAVEQSWELADHIGLKAFANADVKRKATTAAAGTTATGVFQRRKDGRIIFVESAAGAKGIDAVGNTITRDTSSLKDFVFCEEDSDSDSDGMESDLQDEMDVLLDNAVFSVFGDEHGGDANHSFTPRGTESRASLESEPLEDKEKEDADDVAGEAAMNENGYHTAASFCFDDDGLADSQAAAAMLSLQPASEPLLHHGGSAPHSPNAGGEEVEESTRAAASDEEERQETVTPLVEVVEVASDSSPEGSSAAGSQLPMSPTPPSVINRTTQRRSPMRGRQRLPLTSNSASAFDAAGSSVPPGTPQQSPEKTPGLASRPSLKLRNEVDTGIEELFPEAMN